LEESVASNSPKELVKGPLPNTFKGIRNLRGSYNHPKPLIITRNRQHQQNHPKPLVINRPNQRTQNQRNFFKRQNSILGNPQTPLNYQL